MSSMEGYHIFSSTMKSKHFFAGVLPKGQGREEVASPVKFRYHEDPSLLFGRNSSLRGIRPRQRLQVLCSARCVIVRHNVETGYPGCCRRARPKATAENDVSYSVGACAQRVRHKINWCRRKRSRLVGPHISVLFAWSEMPNEC